MIKGVLPVLYKEFIHILRDPRTLFLMLLIPGIQLTIFGYAIDVEVENVPTIVYNLDGRERSRDLIDVFRNTGTFKIVGSAFSNDELIQRIVAGDAQVGIKIPPDYTDNLVNGRPAQIQVLIDGSDSTVAMQALNVSNEVALRESIRLAARDIRRPQQIIESRARVLFNPGMRTERFMVPGLVGIVMQLVTMFLTAFAIVREKEQGTLEQLMVTPVSRFGLMIGKLVPYAIIGAIETTFVVLLMRFLFQVPIEGSLALLAALALLFLFTALGLGLFVSTITTSQVQAMQVAFLIMLPSVLLSGFMFPLESMPLPIFYLAHVIPVTYFIQILRGIILRGADFGDLWTQTAILAVFGLALLTLSAWRFRKTAA